MPDNNDQLLQSLMLQDPVTAQMMAAQGYKPEQGPVMEFLDLFSRPSEALAGLLTGMGEDPKDRQGQSYGPLGGLWGGLTGKKYAYSDNPLEDIPLKMALDPLNLLFGAGLVSKGAKGAAIAGDVATAAPKISLARAIQESEAVQKVTEALGGTRIGQMFGHQMSGKYYPAEVAIQGAMRGAGEAEVQAARLAEEGMTALKTYFAEQGMSRAEAADYLRNLQQAFERPGEAVAGVLPEHVELLKPLHAMASDAFEARNAAREALGLAPGRAIEESGAYTRVPRILTEEGAITAKDVGTGGAGKGLKMESGGLADPSSRELYRWEDATHVGPGQPKALAYGSVDNPRTGIITDEAGRFFYAKDGEMIPVNKVQATQKELVDAGVVKKNFFVENPFQAFAVDITKKERQTAFLKLLGEEGEAGQWLTRLEKGAEIPAGWRNLKIPGLEDWAAPKWPANRIEQIAKIAYDPDLVLGKMEEAVNTFFNKTKVGSLVSHYVSAWKRLVLGPHPGFYTANAISDTMLLYTGGVSAYNIPTRIAQGGAVTSGKGKPVIEGMSNEVLRHELQIRGAIGNAWADSEVLGELSRAKDIKYYQKAADALPDAVRPVGNAIKATGEAASKGIDWMFTKIGGTQSDITRSAAAIDFLKREMSVGRKLSPELLDEAALYSKRILIDYGDLTSFERSLQKLVPFYTWYRGILGRSLVNMGEDPQKLNRLGQMLNFSFTPLGQEDRNVAPDWQKGKAPVTGFRGLPFTDIFGSETGNPMELLMSRFVPHGTVNELMSDLGSQAMNLLSPVIKSPLEILQNWSYFKKKPVDPVAGGFPGTVVNPLTWGLTGDYAPADRKHLGMNLSAGLEHLMMQSPIGAVLPPLEALGRATGIPALQDPANLPPTTAAKEFASIALRSKFLEFDRGKAINQKKIKVDRELSELKRGLKYSQLQADETKQEQYLELIAKFGKDRVKRMGFTEDAQ